MAFKPSHYELHWENHYEAALAELRNQPKSLTEKAEAANGEHKMALAHLKDKAEKADNANAAVVTELEAQFQTATERARNVEGKHTASLQELQNALVQEKVNVRKAWAIP